MDFEAIAKSVYQTQYGRFTGLRQKKQTNSVKQVGNYRIGGKLGEGSNGFVYSAYRLDSNKKLAVKIIPKVEENVQKLESEIKILESIKNKNIIKIEQVVSDSNKVFIFMELCSNGDLFNHIKNHGKLPEKKAAQIFIKIHSALTYIHDKGITHRDVKAENILFDDNMNPKLGDFGLAQFYNRDHPVLDTWCGSFNYVAPEILKKKRYRPELIDLWSLCVTLYIMLTGKQPFNRDGDRIATKQSISTFDWDRDVLISLEAFELFNAVFVPAQHRISLSMVKNTQFYKKYQASLSDQSEQQFQFGLLSTRTFDSSFNPNPNPQSNLLTVTPSPKPQKPQKKPLLQNTSLFQTVQSKQVDNLQSKSKVQLIKLLRNQKWVRSVQPSNKFRVRKSAPKRNQSFEDF